MDRKEEKVEEEEELSPENEKAINAGYSKMLNRHEISFSDCYYCFHLHHLLIRACTYTREYQRINE